MTGQKPRRGIVDPWRIVEPLYKPAPPPPPPENKRIDLTQIDIDADLRAPQQCAIRCRSGSILIRSKKIESGNDALRELARCLKQLALDKANEATLRDLEISVHIGAAPETTTNARLATAEGYEPTVAICFHRQTCDDGMLRLIKFLNAVSRRPANADVLKKWGVVPMMR